VKRLLRALAAAVLVFLLGTFVYSIFWQLAVKSDLFIQITTPNENRVAITGNSTSFEKQTMTDRAEVLVMKNINVLGMNFPFLPLVWTRLPDLAYYHLLFFVALGIISLAVMVGVYSHGRKKQYEREIRQMYGSRVIYY